MAILKLTCKHSESQKRNNSSEAMLMYRYTHQAKTTYFFTGKNIDIQYFDKKNQCIKKAYSGHNKLNVLLSVHRQKIEDIINTALANDINPTVLYVKNLYNTNKEQKAEKIKVTFWAFVDGYFKEIHSKLNPNTLRCYNNVINNLKSYEKYENITLDWGSFDTSFYYKFLDYYTGYKGLGNNGFGKIIKVLKSILNCATDRGINGNLSYKRKEFKALKEDVHNIYLNEDELKKIIALDFNENKKLDRARDLFIIGCYTGLRFSDFSTLTPDNISKDLIKIKTQKTGVDVVIPILPEVKKILEKYNGKLPKAYCNQKMNEYLKLVAQKAKLNDIIQKSFKSGNKQISKSYMKWQIVCTHTARRSFATNMYKRGLSTLAIMQITGHTTDKSFMAYIKITKEENAIMILEQLRNSA
ncbi:tyrosine-type recombinase/integrase [Flavobacterium sp. ST-75]|uniref:Tyrosine-type recombinase/integrase n=1 Tax=Flavobacterium rhizophilum TaxID=3163296 RepID=A0ABW8YCJ6_9FLAO